MRTGYQIMLIVILGLATGTSIAEPQSFGRLFMTAKQRSHLDELRRAKPEVFSNITEDVLLPDEPDEAVVEKAPVDALTVKGVVYRENRKNTAWLNGSNTNDGDLALGPVKIDESDIKGDRVDIDILDSDSRIVLKVGETYDPYTGKITDITTGAGADKVSGANLNEDARKSQNNERRK